MNRIRIFIILSLLASMARAEQNIPRDTSYTASSAYMKYRKEYPSIQIVRAEEMADSVKKFTFPYVSYGERTLSLDLYSRETASKELKPAVILVHGGGWRAGDKSLMAPLACYLAQNGYTALPVEYRLSLEATYPAAIDDINSAVDWARKHGTEYGIDTSRIAILGCSAGAQIAGLIGLKFGSTADSSGKCLKRIQAIINIDGVMDFTCEEALEHEDDSTKKVTCAGTWFGGRYSEKPELWKDASPVYYVDRNAPPILFINSSRPRFHAGRDEVIRLLDHYGIYSEVREFEDAPHSFWLFDPWFEQTGQWIVEFLNTVFSIPDSHSSTQ